MRIAVYQSLPSGGAKRAVYEWTRRLSEDHTIDVFSLEVADHDYCDLRPHVTEYFIYNFQYQRLFLSPFGRLNPLQRVRDLHNIVKISQKIGSDINNRGYDVIFAHPCLYTTIPIVLQFCEAPSVYYLHEPFGPKVQRELERPYLKRNRTRRLIDRFDPLIPSFHKRVEDLRIKSLGRTIRMLANSEHTRRHMIHSYSIDVAVSYLGVSHTDFYKMPSVEKEHMVISVGELAPRKGFDFLIESIALIPSMERPLLKLVCNRVNSDERRYILDLANRKGVTIELLLDLGTDELAIEYNKAEVCVYSPISEPFGLVPLESMACGTPVVAVAEGGVSESVTDGLTGRLTPRDPVRFAEVLRELLVNEDVRRQYGETAQAHVRKRWTWDESTSRIAKHLYNVAGTN